MFAKTLNREVNSLLGEPACRCMKHYCTFWLVKFSQSPDSVDVDAKKKAKKKTKKHHKITISQLGGKVEKDLQINDL